METVKIYLSGAMSGLSFEEMSKWRNRIMDAIRYGDYHLEKKPIFFNPTQYYSFDANNYNSEKEIMEFDLYNLRNSDLVIVNFDNGGLKSIGTAMELMLAKELHIPVVAFGGGENIHPWVSECCTRICNNMKEAVEHTIEFYMN